MAAKKKPVKKATPVKAKKKATKTAVAAKPAAPVKIGTYTTAISKSELLNTVSGYALISRKQAAAVFEALTLVIQGHVAKGTPFKFNGLFKIKVGKSPAKKAREGRNPATGEMIMLKPKPASKKVKILPLKNLKNMI